MLPIEEGWLERHIINSNFDSDEVLDFIVRTRRYWQAQGDLQKLKEMREARGAERKMKGVRTTLVCVPN